MVDDHGFVDANREQRAQFVARQLAEQVERDVRRERETRSLVPQSAALDPFLELADLPVRIDGEPNDVRLHEAHWSLRPHGHHRGLTRDVLERSAQLRDGRVRGDGPDPARPSDGDVRRQHVRKLGIEASLDLRNAIARRAAQLRDDDDPGFHRATARLRMVISCES